MEIPNNPPYNRSMNRFNSLTKALVRANESVRIPAWIVWTVALLFVVGFAVQTKHDSARILNRTAAIDLDTELMSLQMHGLRIPAKR